MDASLLSSDPTTLHAKRPATDKLWGFLFVGVYVALIGFGVWGAQNADLDTFVHPPADCSQMRRRLGADGDDPPSADDWLVTFKNHAYFFAPMLVFLLAVGVAWIWLLRHCARVVTYVTLAMVPVGCFVGAGAILTTMPQASYGCIALIVVGLLYLLIICCMRSRIELTAALITKAVDVLGAHPGIIGAAVGTKLLYLALLAGGVASAAAVLLTGGWVSGIDTDTGEKVCVWEMSTTAEVGLGVAGVALLWLTFLAFTIRFFVTSFVTACWWFDTEGGDALPTAADGSGVLRPASTGAPVRRGLGLAFGKSFGTLSLAASVLTACEIVNNMARNAERRSNNICVCLVMCCLQCIMRYIQWLTKFCVAWHAVTAQPFCTSARGVFDMLGRHGLAVLVVDRFTSLVMHMGSLFLALVVAGGTTLVVKAYTDGQSGLPQEQADLMLAVFGITAWVLSSVVLNFFGALVLNIVDAAYICFALDLDTQAAHRHEMRQVLILVAKPTTVVQQPGGGAAVAVPVGTAVAPVPTAVPVGSYA